MPAAWAGGGPGVGGGEGAVGPLWLCSETGPPPRSLRAEPAEVGGGRPDEVLLMLAQAEIDRFWREGWLLVPDLLTHSDVELLREQLGSIEAGGPAPGLTFDVHGRLAMADGENNIALLPDSPLSRIMRYQPVLSAAQQIVGSPVKLTGAGYLDGGRQDGGHYWHQ